MTEARNPNTGCLTDILLWVIGGIAVWLAMAGAWIVATPFLIVTLVLLVVEVKERL